MKKLVLCYIIISGIALPIAASSQTSPTRFLIFGEFLIHRGIWESTVRIVVRICLRSGLKMKWKRIRWILFDTPS